MLTTGFIVIAVLSSSPTLKAPILALYRDDGVVFAEIRACPGDGVRTFYVDQAYSRWSVLAASSSTAPTRIRLFEVPAGWILEGRDPLLSHPELHRAGTYLIWLRTRGDDQAAFAFDTPQLDATTRDLVLTTTGRDRDDNDPAAAPMPRPDFERRAELYCEEHHG
ncbi:hypothetical protein CC117_13040 [Parafrankia colletiae]|uniref:Uncharacterized protein n=2 Tax=Parafrankia colletiae TaxID=573497 RepID=A0A1S1R5E3_9ACTN|nr:hypothetical protein CC117_13040 [Parafrankia colletiae]